MPHFFSGDSLFFGSRSQSSGDRTQDVNLCNQMGSRRVMAHFSTFGCLSRPQIASLSLSLTPLGLNSVCLRCRHSASGALTPGVLSQLGRPHALQAPCLTPIPRLMWFRLASGRLIRTPPTFSCQPSPANLLLPTFSCQPPPASSALFHRLRQGTNAAFFLFQG